MTNSIRLLIALAALPLSAAAFAQASDADRAFQADLLADAAARTSSAEGATSGYIKNKFTISDGGDNTLSIGGFVQTRYLLNFRDDAAGENEDFTNGFNLRRTRLNFGGTVWSKSLSYYVMGDFNRNTGNFELVDAYGNYKFNDNWSIRWGQFKTQLVREENVSDTVQLAVERSVTNAVFTQSRSQGVSFQYATEEFRATGYFTDGLRTNNTSFDSSTEADYAIGLRAEYRTGGGDWKRFDDFTSWRGSDFGMLFGAAIHHQDGGETGGTADTTLTLATADISAEGDGWNAFAEGIWRRTEPGSGGERDDFGVVVQAGVFIADQVELFARYDVVIPDDVNGDEDFSTITAGVNYYLSPESHAVKFSADVLYFLDAQAENALVSQATGDALLSDTEDDQIGIRLQMQVMF